MIAIVVLIGAAVLLFVVFPMQTMLAVSNDTRQNRPELLSDAVWGDPSSARKFNAEFAAGTPETALLEWLGQNRFALDRVSKSAERRIGGMPCNERVSVKWTTDALRKLKSVSVVLNEAGCL